MAENDDSLGPVLALAFWILEYVVPVIPWMIAGAIIGYLFSL